MADLEIRNLHVSAGEKSILRGVDLHVRSGEFHALMGPNGSGKSTLANAIMGHPNLEVTEGQILFDGEDITEADPDERAVAGLFMAFQYPVAIPGVTTTKYLRMVINAHREARGEPPIPLKEFRQTVEAAMELTNVPKEFSSRYINDGFSGGEKKRMEILQMALQKPKLAVLDETDSGLDIDALNTVANGVNTISQGSDMGVLIITHYQRILHMVIPQFVHIMFDGRIVKEGGPELVERAREARLRLDPRRGRRRGMSLTVPASGEFPVLEREGIAYLDSAATSQTPRSVIEAMDRYYLEARATVHRSTYRSPPRRRRCSRARATAWPPSRASRRARPSSRATRPRRSNLVAWSWGREQRRRRRPHRAHGDGAPLQHRAVADARAGARGGARVRRHHRRRPARPRLARRGAGARSPKVLAVAHVSNVLSTINPLEEIVRRAHAAGAIVVVDGAQAVPHLPVDVVALGADFYAWTGHKAYGPTGIGVLHGRAELLEAMPPWLGGGHMIKRVGRDESTYLEPPARFEAGTSAVAEAIGLGAAVDFLSEIGMDEVRAHGREIAAYALERVGELDDVTLYGPADVEQRGGALAFNIEGAHPHDVSEILGREGVCIRAGHHCAQPLMRRLGVAATSRASFAVHTTREDVDRLVDALGSVRSVFG